MFDTDTIARNYLTAIEATLSEGKRWSGVLSPATFSRLIPMLLELHGNSISIDVRATDGFAHANTVTVYWEERTHQH